MFLRSVGVFAAALAACAGCVGPGSEKVSEAAVEKPLRVAGASSPGARPPGRPGSSGLT